jgi:hypothetical protein
MNIHTFAAEFTKDLESFVRTPLQITPLEAWDPRKQAAPERHAACGAAAGISTNDQIYMLETQNRAFEIIESMLRIFLTPKTYVSTLDPVKEQVWLFGCRWLEIYYGLLTEPTILRSEFYRKDHERFLELLRRMLHPVPTLRARFIDILRAWDSTNTLLTADVSETSGAFVVPSATLPVNDGFVPVSALGNPSMSVPQVQVQGGHQTAAQQQAPQVPQGTQRLVLAPRAGHGEHNKTRKSPRN